MRHTGRSIPLVAGLLALLLGVPGLFAGCPHCVGLAAQPGPGCHQRGGPELHPGCCGGGSAPSGCCGELRVPEPAPVAQAAAAPAVPEPAPLVQAPIAAAPAHLAAALPVPASDGPPACEGASLSTRRAVLLI